MVPHSKCVPAAIHDQIDLFTRLYPNTTNSALAKQFDCQLHTVKNLAARLGLKKTDAHKKKVSKQTRFQPGHVSWNKGKSYPSHPNAIKHQFKRGSRPANWLPIGATRYLEGYLQRKVTDTGDTVKDYVMVQRLVWIDAHGSIPDGHCIIFKDGNRENFDISNLECLSRGELMRRNSIQNYGPDVIGSIRALARFKRQLKGVQHERNSQ